MVINAVMCSAFASTTRHSFTIKPVFPCRKLLKMAAFAFANPLHYRLKHCHTFFYIWASNCQMMGNPWVCSKLKILQYSWKCKKSFLCVILAVGANWRFDSVEENCTLDSTKTKIKLLFSKTHKTFLSFLQNPRLLLGIFSEWAIKRWHSRPDRNRKTALSSSSSPIGSSHKDLLRW